MWDTLAQFWHDNNANIIVSLVISFVFFVLGPLGLWFSGKRIRRERIRKAKEALIDLLEGMIVNQANVDEAKLRSVIRAVERDIDIDLSGEYHIDYWLGDVVLRFEKSRHLSAEQKQQYYDAVRKIIDEIHSKTDKKTMEVPRKYEPILNDLKSALSSGETTRASHVVEELERALVMREHSQDPLWNVFQFYTRLYQKSPFTFSVAAVLILVIYGVVLAKVFPMFPS